MFHFETPHHVLSRCVFISKKFPRLLAEREIIANALFMFGISPPNCLQKYKRFQNSAMNLCFFFGDRLFIGLVVLKNRKAFTQMMDESP